MRFFIEQILGIRFNESISITFEICRVKVTGCFLYIDKSSHTIGIHAHEGVIKVFYHIRQYSMSATGSISDAAVQI